MIELFVFFKTQLEKLGYRVYDGELPDINTKYPFIYLGDVSSNSSRKVKNAIHSGNATINIHIWVGSVKQRGTLSAIADQVSRLGRSLRETKTYSINYRSDSFMSVADTSTGTALLHGVVSFSYDFLEKENL